MGRLRPGSAYSRSAQSGSTLGQGACPSVHMSRRSRNTAPNSIRSAGRRPAQPGRCLTSATLAIAQVGLWVYPAPHKQCADVLATHLHRLPTLQQDDLPAWGGGWGGGGGGAGCWVRSREAGGHWAGMPAAGQAADRASHEAGEEANHAAAAAGYQPSCRPQTKCQLTTHGHFPLITLTPASASSSAANRPAGPLPTTTTGSSLLTALPGSAAGREGSCACCCCRSSWPGRSWRRRRPAAARAAESTSTRYAQDLLQQKGG